MPAIYPDFMGVKMVTYGPENSSKGLPTYHAMVQLFETVTGKPLATIEAGALTDLRTAAVSAAAARLLARPDSSKLAILGSGAQARSHLKVFRHVFSLKEITVWSRRSSNAQRFARDNNVLASASVKEAVEGADIIVAATSAKEPVLCGKWIKPGANVCSVGAYGASNRELDDEAMKATIIVDSRVAAKIESGDIISSNAEIYAELGELIAGMELPKNSTTVFKSVGMAVEDLAAARLVYTTLLAKRK
jgi:thiomorpholine-carboxylate dehydrogenase